MSGAAESDVGLARWLAGEAGAVLLDVRARVSDTARRRAEGDRVAQDFLAAQLAAHRPLDCVLSEEAHDDAARLSANRVWIVDPLDGTSEFGELERTDWAVHVALWESGELAAGAVALPALGATYASDESGDRPPARAARPRIAVSRTRPPEQAHRLATALHGEIVAMGSAGAKAMAVVRGDVDLFLHAGGQYEWDSAAPVAVARAAGLHASRLDGTALVYNREDPWLPDLLIARPELADVALTELGKEPV